MTGRRLYQDVIGLATAAAVCAVVFVVDGGGATRDTYQWVLGAGMQTVGTLLGLVLVGVTYLRTRTDALTSEITPDVMKLWNTLGVVWWGGLRQAYFNQNSGNWLRAIDVLDNAAWGEKLMDLSGRIYPRPRSIDPALGREALANPVMLLSHLREVASRVDPDMLRTDTSITSHLKDGSLQLLSATLALHDAKCSHLTAIHAANHLLVGWQTKALLFCMALCLTIGVTLLFLLCSVPESVLTPGTRAFVATFVLGLGLLMAWAQRIVAVSAR